MTTSAPETGTEMIELFRKLISTIDRMMLDPRGFAKVCLILSATAWIVITILQVIKVL